MENYKPTDPDGQYNLDLKFNKPIEITNIEDQKIQPEGEVEVEYIISQNQKKLEDIKKKYTFADLSKVIVNENGFEIDGKIMNEKDIDSYAWKSNQDVLSDLYKKKPGDDDHIPPGNRLYN